MSKRIAREPKPSRLAFPVELDRPQDGAEICSRLTTHSLFDTRTVGVNLEGEGDIGIHISPEIEARLTATARAEGMSVDGLLARLIDEREQLAAIIGQSEAQLSSVSREEIQARIERGFRQSERGEVVDGDTFTTSLLDEMERKRHVG